MCSAYASSWAGEGRGQVGAAHQAEVNAAGDAPGLGRCIGNRTWRFLLGGSISPVYTWAMKYKIALQKSDEGYSVSVPGLPGCWSQGATEQEALANIRDAIREYLAARA